MKLAQGLSGSVLMEWSYGDSEEVWDDFLHQVFVRLSEDNHYGHRYNQVHSSMSFQVYMDVYVYVCVYFKIEQKRRRRILFLKKNLMPQGRTHNCNWVRISPQPCNGSHPSSICHYIVLLQLLFVILSVSYHLFIALDNISCLCLTWNSISVNFTTTVP